MNFLINTPFPSGTFQTSLNNGVPNATGKDYTPAANLAVWSGVVWFAAKKMGAKHPLLIASAFAGAFLLYDIQNIQG
jgi:hypothetical protein